MAEQNLAVPQGTPYFMQQLAVPQETPYFMQQLAVPQETPYFMQQLAVPQETPEIVAEAVVQLFSKLDNRIVQLDVIDSMHKYCDSYNDKDVPGGSTKRISHEKPNYQLAYLIRYFYPHIEVTMDVLNEIASRHLSIFKSILNKDVVRICCLGGGPLPEIFALGMCMQQLLKMAVPTTEEEQRKYQRYASMEDHPGRPVSGNPARPLLSVHSLDLHAPVWKECFNAVADLMAKHNVAYIPKENVMPVNCDLTKPEDVCKNISYVEKCDVVFASKVFSDIWSLGEAQVTESLRQLLHGIPVKALFIYIDNQDGESVRWFKRHDWETSGFRELCRYEKSIKPKYDMPLIDFDKANKRVDAGKLDKTVTVKVLLKESESPPSGIDTEAQRLADLEQRVNTKRPLDSRSKPIPKRTRPKLNVISCSSYTSELITPTEFRAEEYYFEHPKHDKLRKT